MVSWGTDVLGSVLLEDGDSVGVAEGVKFIGNGTLVGRVGFWLTSLFVVVSGVVVGEALGDGSAVGVVVLAVVSVGVDVD
ncbi:hypothetical protein NSMS1_07200 [Nostoc sp. MS1]|nr:hypothetical protein NSMS1_07200 [Nostoc sp. MS1]